MPSNDPSPHVVLTSVGQDDPIERGVVLAVTPGRATVRMTASAACDSCSQASLCHPGSDNYRDVQVDDPLGTTPGQEVQVRLPKRGAWLAMGLVYGVPIVALLLGALWGYHRPSASPEQADLAAAIGAVTGLICGFVLLRWSRPWYEKRAALVPVILRIVR